MLTNAAVLLALAVPAPVAAPSVAPPPTAVLDVVHFSGSGCPAAGTTAPQSPDRQAVTLIYSEYGVFVGPSQGTSSGSRSCDAVIRVTPPAGYTSAVDHIDQRGATMLPARATGEVRVTYRSANSSPIVANERLRAPSSDSWQTAHRIPASRQVFGPCGRPHFVVVQTELRVSAPTGVDADAAVYSTDFATNNLTWKRC